MIEDISSNLQRLRKNALDKYYTDGYIDPCCKKVTVFANDSDNVPYGLFCEFVINVVT